MSARARWITIIVGLLLANAIAVVVLVVFSGGGSKSRVLPGYSTQDWKQ